MFNFKKPALLLAKNPQITLLIVMYLLIVISLMPVLAAQAGKVGFYFISILLLLFTSAFFSGFFGMIKFIVTNEHENPYFNTESLTKGFFGSIPKYMLPVLLLLVSFFVFRYSILILADKFFGNMNELFLSMLVSNYDTLSSSQDAVANFIATLPHDTKIAILKRSAFLYTGFLAYFLLTIYSIPSLYCYSNNPFIALKEGVLSIIKKPLFSISLFLLILICHLGLIFVEAVFSMNKISMFIALVLRVCFIAYVIVLIFSLYEENFCNNRTDSVGENGSCN